MEQIGRLASAGCEIVRVAVPKSEDADALKRLVYLSPLPIVADIHFNASLALKAIEAGVAKVRINPGNIGGPDRVAEVVTAAKAKGIPMRVGRQLRLVAEAPDPAGPAGHGGRTGRRGARAGSAARVARLSRLCDLGQVELRADDDPCVPPALREGALPASPRCDRGRASADRLDQERHRHRDAPDGRHRRHDQGLAHRRPGQGDRGRLRHPEIARSSRARARDDRLPVVRARQRRCREAGARSSPSG